jgi:hypothetical protein
MKYLITLMIAAGALATIATDGVADKTKGSARDMTKAVVHVNFGDPERQGHALENIENILSEVPKA